MVPDFDVALELFDDFAFECCTWCFTRFDLASGELPQATELPLRTALRTQDLAVVDDDGSHDVDGLLQRVPSRSTAMLA